MKDSRPKSKKKILIAALAAVTALTVILGSTFLWFTASQEVENVFNMDSFDVRITEEFEPTVVVPGVEIDKKVGVENLSNVPVAVRVKLQESLQLLTLDSKENPDITYNITEALGDDEIIVTISQNQLAALLASGYAEVTITGQPANVVVLERNTTTNAGTKTEYAAYVDDGTNRLVRYTPEQAGPPAAAATYEYAVYTKQALMGPFIHNTTGDMPAAYHNYIELLFDSAKWLGRTTPDDGWYYYNKLVGAGEMTEYIIKGVSFKANMTNTFKGATYTLTPTLEAVQGLQEAVDTEWGGNLIVINGNDITLAP